MNVKAHLPIAFLIVVLLLSGCAQTQTTRILSKDQAQVAITLNKDFETTVVSVNDGERVVPCISPKVKRDQAYEDKDLKVCGPVGQGKVLYSQTYKVEVREGSVCISIWVGNHRFDFCDPPYKLSF